MYLRRRAQHELLTKKVSKLDNKNQIKSPLYAFSIQCFVQFLTVSVVSIVVLTILGAIFKDENAVSIILAVACFIGVIYGGVITYITSARFGERDYNLAKYNHINKDELKGLKAGLIAIIPNVIIVMLNAIVPDGDSGDMLRLILVGMNFEWSFLAQFTPSPFIFLPGLFVFPVISWIGYRNGFRLINIFDKLVYKKSREKDKRFR